MGKTLCKKVREAAQAAGYQGLKGFGKAVPEDLNAQMAPDLKEVLDDLLK